MAGRAPVAAEDPKYRRNRSARPGRARVAAGAPRRIGRNLGAAEALGLIALPHMPAGPALITLRSAAARRIWETPSPHPREGRGRQPQPRAVVTPSPGSYRSRQGCTPVDGTSSWTSHEIACSLAGTVAAQGTLGCAPVFCAVHPPSCAAGRRTSVRSASAAGSARNQANCRAKPESGGWRRADVRSTPSIGHLGVSA